MSEAGTDSASAGPSPGRRAELAANLAALRGRVARACAAAGRDPAEVTVIAVTKSRPASDVRLLVELGLMDIGENRDQEAVTKVSHAADLGLDVTWHFVGQLQTNKCRSVAAYADVIHSVDRVRLIEALGREARRHGRIVQCLVQIDLDGRPERGGVSPSEAVALGAEVAGTAGLSLGGVMAVAPLGNDPARGFARLAETAERLRNAEPAATIVSAGMSADLESAVAYGATHLRIGTALLGARRGRVG